MAVSVDQVSDRLSSRNMRIYDSDGNPVSLFMGAIPVQLYHDGVAYQAGGGGGGISLDEVRKYTFFRR